jgi:2'-phosphotransferase
MHVTVQDVADRIDAGKLLTAITLENAPAECVHGTYLKAWERIKTEGLSRMTRQHMHFTDSLTKKEGQQQVSGFRSSCNVLIYVDLQRAIAAGVRFFRAANGVILTEGHDGLLTPEFFSKVTDRDGIEMTV